MPHALFICSQNKLRSPAAEAVFAKWPGIETDSAGLNNDAETPLTPEQFAWADIIFVMEKSTAPNCQNDSGNFSTANAWCASMYPDDYAYMQPELVTLLEAKVRRFVVNATPLMLRRSPSPSLEACAASSVCGGAPFEARKWAGTSG